MVDVSSSTATPAAHTPNFFVYSSANKAVSHHQTTSDPICIDTLGHEEEEPHHNGAVLSWERTPGMESSTSEPGHNKRRPEQLVSSAMVK
jgi:hypothetical protein